MNFLTKMLLTDTVADTAAAVAETTASSDFGDAMNSTLTFGERIATGAQGLLFGMAVVFAVLILIWGILEVFRIIFYDIPNKKKAEAEGTPAADETPAESIPEPAVEEAAEADDGELVAAITAAIAMMMEESGQPQTSFRVVSFRRTASK